LPVIGLIIWAMLMIGTKVSFGSVLIVLGISISVFILKAIHNSKNWFNLGVLTVLLAAAIAIAPITPIGNNLDLTFGTNIAKQEKSPADVDADGKKQAAQQLLSGRKDFLKEKNRSEEQRLNSSHVSISYAVFCL